MWTLRVWVMGTVLQPYLDRGVSHVRYPYVSQKTRLLQGPQPGRRLNLTLCHHSVSPPVASENGTRRGRLSFRSKGFAPPGLCTRIWPQKCQGWETVSRLLSYPQSPPHQIGLLTYSSSTARMDRQCARIVPLAVLLLPQHLVVTTIAYSDYG